MSTNWQQYQDAKARLATAQMSPEEIRLAAAGEIWAACQAFNHRFTEIDGDVIERQNGDIIITFVRPLPQT